MSLDRQDIAVLYVIGSGRSGSTIFGAAAGLHPKTIAVGELNRLGREEDPLRTRRCSCGEILIDCPFWSEVMALWDRYRGTTSFERFRALQPRYERLRSFPFLLKEHRHPSASFRAYQEATLKLYEAVAKVSGAQVLVDTSKYAMRAAALKTIGGLDVRFVHLIRDGRGVFWSLKKYDRRRRVWIKRMRSKTKTWLTPFEWLMLNRIAEAVTRDARFVRIRYEDFVSSPQRNMNEVGGLLGLDFDEVGRGLGEGSPINFGHMVAGNMVRLNGPVSLKLDESWEGELPGFERAYFWTVAGSKARRYGYERVPVSDRVGNTI
jgi:hypothetical protein